MKRVTLRIVSPINGYTFRLIAHPSDTPKELRIEDEFYTSVEGHKLPEGRHYELEILNHPAEFGSVAGIHWHTSTKTHGIYVCYLDQIADKGRIQSLLTIWGCGVVYSHEHHKDFAPGGKLIPNFINWVEKEHGIRFVGIEFLEAAE